MAKSHTPSNLAFIMKEIHFIICFYQAFEKMTWPNIKQSENTEMFKSKLRYQVKIIIFLKYLLMIINVCSLDSSRRLQTPNKSG